MSRRTVPSGFTTSSTRRPPQALICLDAFHVVKWAGGRLDELRRRLAAELRAAGHEDQAAALGAGMRALRKRPENLTTGQRTALARIAAGNRPLYKGYLIKEQLREAFRVKGADGEALLNGLISWAAWSRIPGSRNSRKPSPISGASSPARSTTAPPTAAPRR
jgi:transposase